MMAFALARFREAQDPVFDAVISELRAGRKRSHWMWFVFPQMRGLGHSPAARRFGVASLAEARAFLADPTLCERLCTATQIVLELEGRRIGDIFDAPDDVKFRSSMTLFAEAAGAQCLLFRQALQRYFGGVPDAATLELLKGSGADEAFPDNGSSGSRMNKPPKR